MLTTSKVAELLGVAPMTVRTLADEGAIPSRRTAGGHRRFLEADVLAFRGRQTTTAGSQDVTRAAVWAAAVAVLLRNARADLGPETNAGAAFGDALRLIEERLGESARAAAPSKPRRR